MPAKGPKRKREESEETSSDEDSADSLMPQKSKQRYTDVWKDFLAYIREHHNYPRSVTTTRKPNETQYSGYIKALRNERGLAATTIWSYFSMLTTKHTTLYGENPAKKFPRLVQRLKTYSKDHVSKKAMPFTPEQVDEFMKRETECSVEDTQTKALVALAYFGGLRCAELRGINMADVRLATSSGKKTVVVNYQGLKSTAEQGQRCFSIPGEAPAFVEAVEQHMKNLACSKISDGPLARRCKKDKTGFVDQPIGKNLLYLLPQKIAVALHLEEGKYAGHSLRRTSARAAADAGATTMDMRRHYGWQGEKTPQRYVDSSTAQTSKMASFLAPSNATSAQPVVVTQAQPVAVTQAHRVTIDINLHVNTATGAVTVPQQ